MGHLVQCFSSNLAFIGYFLGQVVLTLRKDFLHFGQDCCAVFSEELEFLFGYLVSLFYLGFSLLHQCLPISFLHFEVLEHLVNLLLHLCRFLLDVLLCVVKDAHQFLAADLVPRSALLGLQEVGGVHFRLHARTQGLNQESLREGRQFWIGGW